MIALLLAACGEPETVATGDVTIAFQSRGEGEIEPCG